MCGEMADDRGVGIVNALAACLLGRAVVAGVTTREIHRRIIDAHQA